MMVRLSAFTLALLLLPLTTWGEARSPSVAYQDSSHLAAAVNDEHPGLGKPIVHAVTWCNSATGALTKTIVEEGNKGSRIYGIAFTRDGTRLAVAYESGQAVEYDPSKFNVRLGISTRHGDSPVWCVAYSPDGNILASGDQNGKVEIQDRNAASDNIWTAHGKDGRGGIASIVFLSNEMLATVSSGGNEKLLHLWDLKGNLIQDVGLNDFAAAVAYSEGRHKLATGTESGDVWIGDVDLKNKTPIGASVLKTLPNKPSVHGLSFEPLLQGVDPSKVRLRLAVAASSKSSFTAQLLYVDDLSVQKTLSTYEQSIWSVAFQPDGKTVASGGDNGNGQPVQVADPGTPEVK
jgi:WD40 repeat protein